MRQFFSSADEIYEIIQDEFCIKRNREWIGLSYETTPYSEENSVPIYFNNSIYDLEIDKIEGVMKRSDFVCFVILTNNYYYKEPIEVRKTEDILEAWV